MAAYQIPTRNVGMAAFAVAVGMLCLPSLCEASAFLRKRERALHAVHGTDLGKEFLKEIENVLGSEHSKATEKRLAPMEVLLRPTLGSLPKNAQGRYGHEAVKYALHRLFVKRHGWYVNGLDSDGGHESSSRSPTSMFVDKVPEYIQGLFEARLGSHGLSTHEVAMLAAILENLVHQEVTGRLTQAYNMSHMDPTLDTKTTVEVDDLLDMYMALYLIDDAPEGATKEQYLAVAEETFPYWAEVKKFVREVRDDRASQDPHLSFAKVSDVVERVADRYGRFQNVDCRILKKDLLTIHDDGSGMIPLSKFYNAALNGQWQFSESREYLRKVGALDESNFDLPKVIVPNYVLGQSNCVGESSYYSQCCISECEDLLEHLERELQTPEAPPERIVELVARLPSSTVSGNRSLKPKLVERLHEIARSDVSGQVPLHGRLFTQWMHHAYPKECPFPHAPGGDVVSKAIRVEIELAPEDRMRDFVQKSGELEALQPAKGKDEETSPWVNTEVHYTDRSRQFSRSGSRQSFFRTAAALAAFGSLAKLFIQSVSSLRLKAGPENDVFFKEKLV